jgi:hypothetical protein
MIKIGILIMIHRNNFFFFSKIKNFFFLEFYLIFIFLKKN